MTLTLDKLQQWLILANTNHKLKFFVVMSQLMEGYYQIFGKKTLLPVTYTIFTSGNVPGWLTNFDDILLTFKVIQCTMYNCVITRNSMNLLQKYCSEKCQKVMAKPHNNAVK